MGRPGGDPMDQYCCPLHGGGGGRPAGTPAGLPAGVAVLHGLCPPGGDGIPGTGRPPVDTAAGIYGLFYQLLPACWGRGLGLAAAAEALRRLERLAPALVLADTVAENTASVRTLERLGFVRTAVHHRAFCREGRMLDIWDYARRWAGPAETV